MHKNAANHLQKGSPNDIYSPMFMEDEAMRRSFGEPEPRQDSQRHGSHDCVPCEHPAAHSTIADCLCAIFFTIPTHKQIVVLLYRNAQRNSRNPLLMTLLASIVQGFAYQISPR